MSQVLLSLSTPRAARAAVVEADDSRVGVADLVERIDLIATALRAAGARAVGLALPNGVDWILADLAAVAARVTCIPIPAFFSDQQRSAIVTRAGLDIWIGTEPPAGAVPLGLAGLPAWRLAGATVEVPADIAKITFTSGTTGTPKGVLLDQGLMERVAADLAALATERGLSRHLCCLPLCVLLENVAGIYAPLLAGGTVLLPRATGLADNLSRFDPAQLAATIDAGAADSLILLPQMLTALTTWAERSGWRPRSLRLVAVGGAPLAPGWLERALTACRCTRAMACPSADR